MTGDRDEVEASRTISRRKVLSLLPGAVVATSLLDGSQASSTEGVVSLEHLGIHPRREWGASLPPARPLEAEEPEDVRFLLIHHSASANDYSAEQVPETLRGFFRSHTGTKGWPDVAYNFFVDRFGGIWEGRTGSLDRPVMSDATGGSQGFALLCCFVGDHQDVAPTAKAIAATVSLLAALADRHGIDTDPGATATFVSRGSNKWPSGARVTTPTIAAHRDMSLTVCPGDAAYALVKQEFPKAVTERRRVAPRITPSSGSQVRERRVGTLQTPAPTDGFPFLPVVVAIPGATAIAAFGGAIVLWFRRRRHPSAKSHGPSD